MAERDLTVIGRSREESPVSRVEHAAARAESPHPHVNEKPKVVYLMGTARSGSTILGVTIGNCANAFYAGELGKWLELGGMPALEGEERARFWRAVADEVDDAGDLVGEGVQLVERSVSLLHARNWLPRRRMLRRYRRASEKIYRAIANTAQATHIVDSSSYPLRALALRRLAGTDFYLIYLVRDPHSVVASFSSPEWRFSKSRAKTNAYIWFTSLLSVLVFLTHRRDRRLFVRYEDFVTDPETVVARIVECIGCDAGPPDMGRLNTGLPFQGNRFLRTNETITLRTSLGSSPPRLPLTAFVQAAWKPVFSLLRPAAAISTPRGRSSPSPLHPRSKDTPNADPVAD